MYPINEEAKEILQISATNRKITWYGTMTTTDGKEYEINTDIIGPGSGKVTSKCSLPFVGGAYSTEFSAKLLLKNVDPETLKNACIKLNVTIEQPPSVQTGITWDAVRMFRWSDISQFTWKRIRGDVKMDIPIGVFYVNDAKRNLYSIDVVANDSMTKFDVDLPGMDGTSRSVLGWLKWACDACGVTLGMTKSQIKAMPNGTRSLIYAVLDSKIRTYRDLISYLAAVLGSVAIINRFDKLVLKTVNLESVLNLTPDDRFTSEYEDTKQKYTGLTLEYKTKATKEYYRNTDAISDTGQVVELGENPFLQISNDSARNAAVQNIIDSLTGITFNPFSASIPSHPEIDLLDMVSFSGGHAPENCYGIITSLTRQINGGVTIRCETPKETKEQERKNVQTSGTSGSRVSGGDMWIKVCSAPEEIIEMVPGLEYSTTELTVNCTTDNTTMQISWTGCYTLDEDATVTADVLVDGKSIYTVSDDQKAGNHVMNVTTGHAVSAKGEYVISIVLREVAL